MEPWERAVFTVKCDLVTAVIDGKKQRVAGRVILFRFDSLTFQYRKVLDTFVKYAAGVVVDTHPRFSRLSFEILSTGIDRDSVVDVLLKLVEGHTLVTFSGSTVFAALGIDEYIVGRYVGKHVELQDFFRRPDGQPFALGPLAIYFGYKHNGRQVILNHDSVQDAYYHLRLFNDHYSANETFEPMSAIMSKAEFCRKYNVY